VSAADSVTSGTLELGDPTVIVELRSVLREAGFTGAAVHEALGPASEGVAPSVDIPLHERRLDRVEPPLGTLIRLLVLDAPVPAQDARRAFAPLRLEELERLGLLESHGGDVSAIVRIAPHDELLIASDRHATGKT
jgi:hypothetical protein